MANVKLFVHATDAEADADADIRASRLAKNYYSKPHDVSNNVQML